MRIISALAILILIVSCSKGQYNSEVLEYRLSIYELSTVPNLDGYYSYTYYGDTTVTINWEHYDNSQPDYISPYSRSLYQQYAIINTPALWQDTTAAELIDLALATDKWYEVVMTAYYTDNYQPRESGESDPIYIHALPIEQPYIILKLRIK